MEKLWNENFVADGFTGFAQNRNADGTFPKVSNPSSGYNSHYYEANIWEGSFYPVFDMAGMIELMGGRKEFTRRLEYACENGHIKFDNEPAFQTVWLFSHSEIRRPDLTAKYADKFLNYFPEEGGYHDDEDGGAMSTMYMFLMSGFFPISCTDRYYLHGTRLPEITYNLSDGKKFVIKGINTSPDNIYVKSATFNGKPLNDCVLTHEDIVSGGTLEFVMDSVPSDWAKFPEDTVRPDDAENLRANIDRARSGIVELNWDAADGADKYYVYCGDSADFATSERNMIAQTESPRYVGVARPGTMWYKVRSVGSNGNVSRNACVAELTVGNDFGNAVDGYDGNIALGKSATASGKSGPAGSTVYDEPAYAVDGNGGTKWSCRSTDTAPGDGTGNYWLEIDLGNTYVVRRWKVAHAQSGGESADYNTKAFSLQAYIDGEWINVDTVDDNVYRVTERVVPAIAARRVRLYITQPVPAGGSVSARIYEFALYASAEREDIDFTESFDGTSLPVGFNLNTSGGGKADFSENGCVTVSTDTSGTVELDKTFDRSFYGVMAHEIRFKNLSSRSNEFANIVFLKNSGNNSYVVTIAVESGRLRYNADNSGWKTVQYKGKDLYLMDNAWYTLKVVNDYETQKTKLYLTGDLYGSGGKTSTAALGDDVFLGEYNFRNKNIGDPDTFEMAIGTGKSGTAFTVDYIKTYVWKEV